MNSEISQELLLRLPLEELEKGGRQALQSRNYDRAYQLLREASRRAPFRTDLRDLLSAAVEGRIESGPRERTADQSTLEAMRIAPPRAAPAQPDSRRGVLGRPRQPEAELDDEPSAPSPMARHRPMRRVKPGQFDRRHRRGPVSALFIGAFVGLVLAGAAAAAGWIYFYHGGSAAASGSLADVARVRQQQVFADAEAYVNQSNFSLAIDRLQTLPPGPERDKRLAGIFMKIGDQGFKQDPPRLQTALDAYSKAVELAPNDPDDGLALAQVYYALAGGSDAKPDGAKDNLARAKQSLQAVLDRTPEYLPACNMMVKVAIAQRDYKLQQQILLKIIQISPKGSEDAIRARESLQMLGFKTD